MTTVFSKDQFDRKVQIKKAGSVFIKKGVLISDENTGIADGFDLATISNFGTVSSGGGDAYSIFMGGSGSTVINAASGTITCSTGEAVFMLGDNSTVVNMGTMYGSLRAVQADVVINSGSVTAGEFGLSAITVDNTGTVEAVGSGGFGVYLQSGSSGRYPQLTNAGIIRGETSVAASGTSDEDFELTNSGTLEGVVRVDDFGDSSLRNTGTILGDMRLGLILTNIPDGTIMSTLRNSGTIEGDILCGSLGDAIRNTGLIDGDVLLGTGDPNFDPTDWPKQSANTFDGRRGRVTGTITGGAANDTIIAGDDGETLAGGGGHDHLTGGRGADTFVVASFAAADVSRIDTFSVAEDLIELDHHVFTALNAHAAPAFTIGTQASGAADHLFYKSATGTLFYDADGDGPAHANAVVRLATGLKLTAGNFSVF